MSWGSSFFQRADSSSDKCALALEQPPGVGARDDFLPASRSGATDALLARAGAALRLGRDVVYPPVDVVGDVVLTRSSAAMQGVSTSCMRSISAMDAH